MRHVALALMLLIAAPAAAHDFWIAPERYGQAGDKADIRATFRIGSAAAPEDWNTRAEKIVALRSFGPDGVTDQQAEVTPGQPGSALLHLKGAGSHIVTLESTPSEIDLPAGEFNAYLDHEGLSEIKAWRKRNGQEAANGRETYARRAKAIIQLGKRPTNTVSRPLGLSLEIVPERNPLMLKLGEALPIRLFFRGKPLAGARLEAESLSNNSAAIVATTDANGRAQFAIPRVGSWKIATVWSVPVSGNPRADFDTLFASLTFGY